MPYFYLLPVAILGQPTYSRLYALNENDMKLKWIYLALTSIVFHTGCKRKLLENAPLSNQKLVVKTIDWPGIGMKAKVDYFIDTTIKRIVYDGGTSPTQRNFTYGNQGLSTISSPQSLLINKYEYGMDGRRSKLNRLANDATEPRLIRTIEFKYNDSGQLSTLQTYNVNQAVRSLISTSNYSYHDGLPSEVRTIFTNSMEYLTRIEGYSDRVSYNPIIFLGESSDPLSHIFNLPLLAYLAGKEKLPTVVRSFIIEQGGGPAPDFEYISSFRVDKNQDS
jgi:hypothetical protein